MAEQIAAHVTLVYPREVTRLDALLERTRLVLPTLPPFRLRLGRLAHFGQPEDGVYVEVEDVEGGYRAARAELLGPPFRPTAVVPHVTIVHPPDISARPRMLAGAGGTAEDREFVAAAVAITAFDGTRWATLATFPLKG
jgi:2'-5' RNA ligase